MNGFFSRVALNRFLVVILTFALCARSIAFAQNPQDPQQPMAAPAPDQQQTEAPPPPQQYPPQQDAPPQQDLPQQGPPPQQQGPLLSEHELEDLVAPVALYPDSLLGQVLVACTYPREVVDAKDWLQQNRYLRGRELMQAAQQQNWDPSVQALVAFPNVLDLLTRDVQWMTDLGNAFLAQQADVMNAIQNLRAQARASGRLRSTPQFQVNTETQGGQSAIEIVPANPQVVYVPYYDPYAVWGPPVYGAYPGLPYAAGVGWGSVFNVVADLASLLPGFVGWLGPRGWGWALGWFAHALFLNNGFFASFGFHHVGAAWGTSVWVHDWHHRMGVPYGPHPVASWNRGRSDRGWTAERGAGWRRFGDTRSNVERARDGYARLNGRPEGARSYAPAPRGGEFARGNPRDEGRSRPVAGNRGYEPRTEGRANGRAFNDSRGPRDAGRSYARGNNSRAYRQASSGRSRQPSSFGRAQHAPNQPHFSAPRAAKAPKAPKMAKSHGGGHSGGGHSRKSHRG